MGNTDSSELAFRENIGAYITAGNVNKKDHIGYTPLHYCILKRNFGVFDQNFPFDLCFNNMKILLEHGADPNIKDRHQRTPLEICYLYDSPDMLKLLLENGANPNNLGKHDKPLLIRCVWTSNIKMVKMLLEHGADVEKKFYGKTPLMYAQYIGQKSIDMTKILLENKANPNSISYDNKTALHYAAENNASNYMDQAHLLIKHNAKLII